MSLVRIIGSHLVSLFVYTNIALFCFVVAAALETNTRLKLQNAALFLKRYVSFNHTFYIFDDVATFSPVVPGPPLF